MIISPKYGVNPAIPKCFLCGEDKNEIILFGKLSEDKEAPQKAVFDKEPCDKCKEYMTIGIILISVRDGESGENPYRTGGWVVIKDDFIKRCVQPEELSNIILLNRFSFVPDDAFDMLGLPREKND